MADVLRRSLAPITDAAWGEIDDQATKILNGNLSGRAVVDFEGPHGWEYGAVNLGEVEAGSGELVKGVAWAFRKVLPLVEIRVPFELSAADLDSLARGGKTPELAPVVQAAQKAALCEETTIYQGFKQAGINGIIGASDNEPLTLPKAAEGYTQAMEDAIHQIQTNGIDGPFDLVLGREPFQTLAVGDGKGYPLKARVLDLLSGGQILWSPALTGGVLLSRRGGDFELTVGQDLSIGYAGHEGDSLRFFITESYAFRVLEPAAAVELKKASGK